MPSYVVEVHDRLGNNTIVSSLPYDQLQFGWELNGPGFADMSVSMWQSEATYANLEPVRRTIYIKRDGTLVWSGPIWNLDANTGDGVVRITASGWISWLDKRLIAATQNYNGVDQFDIAWDLINYTQNLANGNLGITRGAEADSGINRDLRYQWYERRIIGEVIPELAAMSDGFDYDIDQNKVFHMYYPRRGSAIGTPFVLDTNVHNIYELFDGRTLASEVHGMGGGSEKTTCIAVVSDATSLNDYGLVQEAYDFGDLKKYADLTKRADRYLNLHKATTRQPQFSAVTGSPAVGTFNVGDTGTITAVAGFFNVNATYRIINIEVHVDNTGVEVVTPHFDARLTP